MNRRQNITALALAALQNDTDGLAELLTALPDDEVRTAAGAALLNLCNGMRAILTPCAIQEAIGGLQQLALDEATRTN